jgi:hypothetical protein
MSWRKEEAQAVFYLVRIHWLIARIGAARDISCLWARISRYLSLDRPRLDKRNTGIDSTSGF